jgi:tetratricopeptide (TPR) repeat protein
MSSYIAGTDYAAYLQARSSIEDIRWDISRSNFDLLLHRESIERLGLRIEQPDAAALEQSDDAGGEGFVTLHCDVSSVETAIGDSPAKFDWGLGRLESAIASLRVPLDTLMRLARTPDQTWAYAQFDIAREAYRGGQFSRALAHIERAINGDQAHAGHRMEHRLHHFLGIVRRGSYSNNSPEIVDLEKAKRAYLDVPRYTADDHKHDAARALCAAGWTSYCQNRLDQALEYTTRALTYSDLAEANFQRAKILMHRGEVRSGLESLLQAIHADPLYAVRCFDNGDFLAHEEAVRGLVVELRDARVGRCREVFAAAGQIIRAVETDVARIDRLNSELESSLTGKSAKSLKTAREAIADIAADVQSSKRLAHRNANVPDNAPFVDVTMSIKEARSIADPIGRLARAAESHSDRLFDLMADEVESEFRRIHEKASARGPFPVGYAIWSVYGIVVLATGWPLLSAGSGGAILLFSGVLAGGSIVAVVLQLVLGEAAARAHRNKAMRIAKEAATSLRTRLLSHHRQLVRARETIQARYDELRHLLEKKSNLQKG